MFSNLPLLSIAIWLPMLGGVGLLVSGDQQRQRTRWLALLVALATFVVTLPLYCQFDVAASGMQFQELHPWINALNANYHLGVDGLSMPLILLTSFMTVLVVIAGWSSVQQQVGKYLACFLFMEGVMIGLFSSQDGLLFYLFWEAMLIPMFLIIGIWGGANRVYATIKFFLYTFLGSILLLICLIYLYLQTGSFAFADYYALKLDLVTQQWLFMAFLIAFAVKIPMWPVHTWLPDAHVEAPTGGSVILAAIMLKMGGYGFLRWNLPITPDASQTLAGVVIVLSLIAIVYIGAVALVQSDMKKLIAYSSISHMGFVTLGLFLFSSAGIEAAMAQMVSHGFISGAMFLCIGVLYDRMHSRDIKDYGGVANTMPVYAALMMFFALANTGLPGTSGFVGEFLVILAAFKVNFWYAAIASTSLVLGAAYTLWMYKRVLFGVVANDKVAALKDLHWRESLVLGILAAAVLGMGLYPNPLFEVMHLSVDNLMVHVTTGKL